MHVFTYFLSSQNLEEEEEKMRILFVVFLICLFAVTFVNSTAAPTKLPTKQPTAAPSGAPSKAPTSSTPTVSPTSSTPSVSPTHSPTAAVNVPLIVGVSISGIIGGVFVVIGVFALFAYMKEKAKKEMWFSSYNKVPNKVPNSKD